MSGDQPPLVTRIAAYIEAFSPEVILTFDPRHGTTCHPDHRETGRLVLEAVRLLESKPEIFLLETIVTFATGGPPQFTTALSEALTFDATQSLQSGDQAWTATTWDMERHPSQFTTEFIHAVQSVPHAQRSVFISRAETAMDEAVTVCR